MMGAHNQFANNSNQRAVMFAILEAADAGELITLAELCKMFSGKSKQAVQSTVRTLIRWDFVVKDNRGCQGATLAPTAEAYSRFRK